MASESYHDVAQICLNGHVITAHYRVHPEHGQPFCDACGEPTITNCPQCNAPIRGRPVIPRFMSSSEFQAPKHCHQCGSPFPWTERKLAAIARAAAASELTEEEQEELQDAAKQVIRRTPEAEGAAPRLKALLAKAGATVASAVRDVVVDVASEAVKKQMGW